MKKQKPSKNIRIGDISCAIWDNKRTINGKEVVIPNVTLMKNYKDKQGNWKQSSNFNLNDCSNAIAVLLQTVSTLVGAKA